LVQTEKVSPDRIQLSKHDNLAQFYSFNFGPVCLKAKEDWSLPKKKKSLEDLFFDFFAKFCLED
jgi:hypothetical protein